MMLTVMKDDRISRVITTIFSARRMLEKRWRLSIYACQVQGDAETYMKDTEPWVLY